MNWVKKYIINLDKWCIVDTTLYEEIVYETHDFHTGRDQH